jgi:hypothetical protein
MHCSQQHSIRHQAIQRDPGFLDDIDHNHMHFPQTWGKLLPDNGQELETPKGSSTVFAMPSLKRRARDILNIEVPAADTFLPITSKVVSDS